MGLWARISGRAATDRLNAEWVRIYPPDGMTLADALDEVITRNMQEARASMDASLDRFLEEVRATQPDDVYAAIKLAIDGPPESHE